MYVQLHQSAAIVQLPTAINQGISLEGAEGTTIITPEMLAK